MPIIKPSDDLCRRLLAIGLPEYRHNRRVLRGLVTQSTGLMPLEHETADELARTVLSLHERGQLAPFDNP